MLSLIGKLVFCAKVIRDGRKFISQLINAINKVKYLHHKINLNKEVRADLNWCIRSMEEHNGVTMFPTEWNVENSEVIYSDASDLAAGGVWQKSWFVVQFVGKNAWMADMDITW